MTSFIIVDVRQHVKEFTKWPNIVNTNMYEYEYITSFILCPMYTINDKIRVRVKGNKYQNKVN